MPGNDLIVLNVLIAVVSAWSKLLSVNAKATTKTVREVRTNGDFITVAHSAQAKSILETGVLLALNKKFTVFASDAQAQAVEFTI